MVKRSVGLVAAGALLLVVVGSVVYAAFGFTSVFSCDEGSNCFLGSFFAPAPEAPDATTPSSAMITSVAFPPAQPPAGEAPENTPAPLVGGAFPQPPASLFRRPQAVRTRENTAMRAPAASSATPEPPPPVAEAAIPSVADTPATDTAPDSGAPSPSPPAEIPTAPTEPEPGVLTDPPAGVVLDENTAPGGPGNAPPAPNVYVPILILPTPVNAPRSR